jgi:chitodextrinase
MISRALARKLRAYIEKAAVSLTDEDALEAIELYPAWKTGTAYEADERIRHDGILYRCVQAHTSQTGWEPPVVPALWTVVSLDEWPEWVQPVGSSDAYNKGDKVSHNDKHWVSDVDANVWEPSIYGWNEVV